MGLIALVCIFARSTHSLPSPDLTTVSPLQLPTPTCLQRDIGFVLLERRASLPERGLGVKQISPARSNSVANVSEAAAEICATRGRESAINNYGKYFVEHQVMNFYLWPFWRMVPSTVLPWPWLARPRARSMTARSEFTYLRVGVSTRAARRP